MSRLLGHEASQKRFADALMAASLHHAWLLYGMKGIGKRSLAEHLAGLAMCATESACGACHACKMLEAGSHPDVFRLALIEGKRDLTVEQIRQVLNFLSLSGAEGGRRVVILDDAERMNGQAANALLKGLEEPSAGSLLLIVCSDLERLPATVRSRCMLQQCVPLHDADVTEVLKQLETPLEQRHLELALALAKGSPGAVTCLQDVKIAEALLGWQSLLSDMSNIDVGKVESWIRQHVKTVPHHLIVQLLVDAVWPVLQESTEGEGEQAFVRRQGIEQALHGCMRWPADVVRHSLRAGPALLACVLELRSALKLVA
ncbi:MAG: DNA polymerase III subunit delta' [Mariprofundus sp.]|nr:DNA polymerase III subunit delta' [Mariprofundus sp.]